MARDEVDIARALADSITMLCRRKTGVEIPPTRSSFPVDRIVDRIVLKSDQVSGVFVAPEIDWQAVGTILTTKGYSFLPYGPKKVADELYLRKILPIETLSKKFSPYLEAVVTLKTFSFSEEEVKGYIPNFLVRNKVQPERGNPILDWLGERKSKPPKDYEKKFQPFYIVTEFGITCYFDVKEFLDSIKMENGASGEFGAVSEKAKFAIYLLERVAEQQVYPDLCGSFDIEKISPFVQYFPDRSGLSLSIIDEKEEIKLGQTFKRKVLIVNNTGKTLRINGSASDSNPQLVSAKIQSLEADPFEIKMEAAIPYELPDNTKKEVPLIFTPKRALLRKGLMPQRPKVTVQLVETLSQISMVEQNKEFTLENPDLSVDVKAPRWTHKGAIAQLQFTYGLNNATYKEPTPSDLAIPIAIEMSSSDIDYIDPSPDKAKNYQLFFKTEKKPETCVFIPKRAGKLHIRFKFKFANASRDSNDWQTEMKGTPPSAWVFPSFWPDTVAFVVPIILGIAHEIKPDLVPQLAPELNATTVTSLGVFAFLGYRFFNWARNSPEG